MEGFEDYEVLNIIGTNLNNTYYKVRNKSTSELLVFKAISYKTSCECEGAIKRRKADSHNVLLDVRNFILHEETNTVYSITGYCKYGSLSEVLKECTKNHEYLDEDFIWNMLYKLTCYIKIFKNTILNLFEIYVDANFDIKLINFTLIKDDKNDLEDLGELLKAVIKPGNEYYSAELNNVLNFLSERDKTVVPTVDAILCHPTVIFKIAQPKPKRLFIKKPKEKEKEKAEEDKTDFTTYHAKLENLRNREAAVKANEDKLLERGRALDRREKKISLMERIVKEKNARADLYLKRSRDVRPRAANRGNAKKESDELVDTSLSADCGDTSLLPTSRKLNVQDIIKPPKFHRTLSERRVRFKSHSPLKEIHVIRRTTAPRELQQPDSEKIMENDSFKKPGKVNRTRFKAHSPLKEIHNIKRDATRRQSLIEQKSENLASDSDKSSEKSGTEKTRKKFLLSNIFSKKIKKPNSIDSSSETHTYEDVEKDWEDVQDCKPINWTLESKRQAFDLLRVMNAEQIKHTYL